jgi:hypothetical protein
MPNPEGDFQEDGRYPGCPQLLGSFWAYDFSRKLSTSLRENNRIKITQAWQNYKLAELEIIFFLKDDEYGLMNEKGGASPLLSLSAFN